MIKGTTQSGFEYAISKERLENYELVEVLAEVDENPLLLPKVVNLLLEKDQAKKLKDHIRDEQGLVSMELLSKEIMEIFQGQPLTKN